MLNQSIISSVAELLANSQRTLFITGAGVSVDSGLPTYRGTGGLYNNESTEEGYSIEQALSADMLQQHPDITWKYLKQVANACIAAQPNAAHKSIARYQQMRPDSWLLTQNIDGLHRLANTPRLIEIHGNAFEFFCMQCGIDVDGDVTEFLSCEHLPVCNKCGGSLRPNVVLFGEMLPEQALNQFMQVLQREPDLVISIGTSAMFPYIVEPVLRARAQGVPTVEINPDLTDISTSFDYRIAMGAADAMHAIMALLDQINNRA